MKNITFSALLTQIMSASRMKLTDLHKRLTNRGENISYQALSSYRAFTAVPPYNKASAILSAVNYSADENELNEILEYSREMLKELNSDSKQYIQQGIRISPKLLGLDMSVDALELLLDRRIAETDEKTLNAYINSLIKADLVKYGFVSENDTTEGLI